MSSQIVERLTPDAEHAAASVRKLADEIGKVVVGQKYVVDRLINAMLCEGHILLEGLPGLAKTTAVKALGEASGLHVRRIQFTPDMLPADVIGTQTYNPKSGDFSVKKGPVFAHLVIADEINRAPAKVQSALLEAMQEHQVSIGDETFKLESPFLVMATQNPVEQEGTYPLPEAQVDRFLFKVIVTYGTSEEEQEIVRRMSGGAVPKISPAVDRLQILKMRDLCREIYVSDKIRKYVVDLVQATRNPAAIGLKDMNRFIAYGASPRASINLERAARVHAVMQGRAYVTPQDIKDIGMDVLRHRIGLSYEAEAEEVKSDQIVKRIFERVDVP
jgi:MoxR-like ATPase